MEKIITLDKLSITTNDIQAVLNRMFSNLQSSAFLYLTRITGGGQWLSIVELWFVSQHLMLQGISYTRKIAALWAAFF